MLNTEAVIKARDLIHKEIGRCIERIHDLGHEAGLDCIGSLAVSAREMSGAGGAGVRIAGEECGEDLVREVNAILDANPFKAAKKPPADVEKMLEAIFGSKPEMGDLPKRGGNLNG